MPKTDTSSGRFRALGVLVDAVQIPDVIQRMDRWIQQREGSRYVAVADAHSIVEAQRDPAFKQILDTAAMVIPDGIPLIWYGRQSGYPLPERVCGPDVFESFCRDKSTRERAHFLYGGATGVPELLGEILTKRFPGVRIAGSYSPPFRPLTEEEDEQVVAMINGSGADILWVGLGCPTQERWIYAHRHRLTVPVVVGVGAAFDFLSGRQPRAPQFVRNCGLEWLYRIVKEPRRLLRRNLSSNFSLAYYWFREMFVRGTVVPAETPTRQSKV